jgi:hypothetical protein
MNQKSSKLRDFSISFMISLKTLGIKTSIIVLRLGISKLEFLIYYREVIWKHNVSIEKSITQYC